MNQDHIHSEIAEIDRQLELLYAAEPALAPNAISSWQEQKEKLENTRAELTKELEQTESVFDDTIHDE